MNTRHAILYYLVLGFSAGIVIDELASRKIFFLSAVLIVCALTAVVLGLCSKKSLKTLAIALVGIALSVTAGFFRSEITLVLSQKETPLDGFVGEKISLVGVVGEEQERRDFNTRLTVIVREINEQGSSKMTGQVQTSQKVSQNIKVVVTTDNPNNFLYGDIVRVTGQVSLPENFYTDTGREFDYVGYLRTNSVRFLVKNASVSVLGHDPPSKILSGLFFAKRAFVTSIGNMLPEPESSLAAGILIDGKQSINGELQEKFRKTGLVHIVVLSGSNVSIVAEAMSKLFAFLPRFLGLCSAIIGILAFTMITGATSTVVRASIMAIIVIISRMLLRQYDPARGLFMATGLMLIQNPGILIHSPSFQLSFLATFAVIEIVPRFEQAFRFLPERFGLREIVTSNILVQAFLFPILSWMTGFVSAVSLPTNLLVLPLVSVTMLLSFLTAVTGLIFRPLALPFAFASHTLLSYELMVVDFFSKFSLANIPFDGFSTFIVVGFYASVIVWVVCHKHLDLNNEKRDDLS